MCPKFSSPKIESDILVLKLVQNFCPKFGPRFCPEFWYKKCPKFSYYLDILVAVHVLNFVRVLV